MQRRGLGLLKVRWESRRQPRPLLLARLVNIKRELSSPSGREANETVCSDSSCRPDPDGQVGTVYLRECSDGKSQSELFIGVLFLELFASDPQVYTEVGFF